VHKLPFRGLFNLSLKQDISMNTPESISMKVLAEQPLISELEIRHRTSQLAEEIAKDFAGKDLVVVVVLKGAFMFATDLLRLLHQKGAMPDMDFIRAASYGSDDLSSGKIKLQLDVSIALDNRSVLLVDDIADTGQTLKNLSDHLKKKGSASVATCVLLDKPSRRQVKFNPEYTGFVIPNEFVVGYGLDYAEKYRSLPYITTVHSK
jgi:hypoxanthine phosphoribosyltransferase